MTTRRSAKCECGRLRSHTPDEATHDAALTALRWAGWCFGFDPAFT